jgi:hypothetical protein
MRRRVKTRTLAAFFAPLVLVPACGGRGLDPHSDAVLDAVDLTGRDIRDTEYCGAHTVECSGDPVTLARFKASRLLLCKEEALGVVPRPDVHDTTLGHTHGRDFRSWWPEGEISRVRDPADPGQVMEIRGCSRDVFLSCFRAHVTVREPGVVYDDVAALDCVRWAPWDPAP